MGKTLMIVLLLSASVSSFAQMRRPDLEREIQGEWKVDIEATIAAYRDSDAAADLSPKTLDQRIERLREFVDSARMSFKFNNHKIYTTKKLDTRMATYKVMRKGGKVINLETKIINEKTHQPVRLQIFFQEEDLIKIVSTETKDLDLYLWRRQEKR